MHYKNGREAKIGDMVVGRVYNNKGLHAGTLISVTPGPDQCSAMLAFLKTREIKDPEIRGLDDNYQSAIAPGSKAHGSANHGTTGAPMQTKIETDFTHCANLMHVDDVASCPEMVLELMKA